MDNFIFGVFIGMIIMAIGIGVMGSKDCEIRTEKKLTPDWELVVKGKTVDTVYVYKSDRK